MSERFEDEMALLLRAPIKLGEIEYSELQLSEPTCDQLIKAGKAGTPMEQLAALINLNAKVPMPVVSQMKQRDLDRAGDFFAHFSDASQTTTGT